MAILGMDGFDQMATGDEDTDNNPLWRRSEENRRLTTPTPPYGRGAIVGIYSEGDMRTKPLGSLTGEVITGFHWRTERIDGGSQFSWWTDVNSVQCTLSTAEAVNGGGFELYRGWKAVDMNIRSTDTDPSYTIQANTWYWIEIKFKSHATTGSIELRVNGDVWINETNINTEYDAVNPGVDAFNFSSSPSDWNYIDNFYIADTSTANNAQVYDFQGPCEIITLSPASDSSITWSRSAGSTNYENVDEQPASNTDYVYTDVSGEVDTYTYTDLPAGNWAIKAISPMARVQQMEPGTSTMTISAGTQTAANLPVDVAGNIQYVYPIWETEDGTNAWTTTDINNLTVSYEYD